MPPDRLKSVSSLLKQVISDVIRDKLKDPRVEGLVSITDIKISRDMRYAKVYVSIFSSSGIAPEENDENAPDKAEEAVKGLNGARGFIRHQIKKELTMKRIPGLEFFLDDSIERGVRVAHVIGALRNEEENIECAAEKERDENDG